MGTRSLFFLLLAIGLAFSSCVPLDYYDKAEVSSISISSNGTQTVGGTAYTQYVVNVFAIAGGHELPAKNAVVFIQPYNTTGFRKEYLCKAITDDTGTASFLASSAMTNKTTLVSVFCYSDPTLSCAIDDCLTVFDEYGEIGYRPSGARPDHGLGMSRDTPGGYSSIPPCYGASGSFNGLKTSVFNLSGTNSWESINLYLSSSMVMVRSSQTKTLTGDQLAICMPIAIFVGLLISSMFYMGVNPFFWFSMDRAQRGLIRPNTQAIQSSVGAAMSQHESVLGSAVSKTASIYNAAQATDRATGGHVGKVINKGLDKAEGGLKGLLSGKTEKGTGQITAKSVLKDIKSLQTPGTVGKIAGGALSAIGKVGLVTALVAVKALRPGKAAGELLGSGTGKLSPLGLAFDAKGKMIEKGKPLAKAGEEVGKIVGKEVSAKANVTASQILRAGFAPGATGKVGVALAVTKNLSAAIGQMLLGSMLYLVLKSYGFATPDIKGVTKAYADAETSRVMGEIDQKKISSVQVAAVSAVRADGLRKGVSQEAAESYAQKKADEFVPQYQALNAKLVKIDAQIDAKLKAAPAKGDVGGIKKANEILALKKERDSIRTEINDLCKSSLGMTAAQFKDAVNAKAKEFASNVMPYIATAAIYGTPGSLVAMTAKTWYENGRSAEDIDKLVINFLASVNDTSDSASRNESISYVLNAINKEQPTDAQVAEFRHILNSTVTESLAGADRIIYARSKLEILDKYSFDFDKSTGTITLFTKDDEKLTAKAADGILAKYGLSSTGNQAALNALTGGGEWKGNWEEASARVHTNIQNVVADIISYGAIKEKDATLCGNFLLNINKLDELLQKQNMAVAGLNPDGTIKIVNSKDGTSLSSMSQIDKLETLLKGQDMETKWLHEDGTAKIVNSKDETPLSKGQMDSLESLLQKQNMKAAFNEDGTLDKIVSANGKPLSTGSQVSNLLKGTGIEEQYGNLARNVTEDSGRVVEILGQGKGIGGIFTINDLRDETSVQIRSVAERRTEGLNLISTFTSMPKDQIKAYQEFFKTVSEIEDKGYHVTIGNDNVPHIHKRDEAAEVSGPQKNIIDFIVDRERDLAQISKRYGNVYSSVVENTPKNETYVAEITAGDILRNAYTTSEIYSRPMSKEAQKAVETYPAVYNTVHSIEDQGYSVIVSGGKPTVVDNSGNAVPDQQKRISDLSQEQRDLLVKIAPAGKPLTADDIQNSSAYKTEEAKNAMQLDAYANIYRRVVGAEDQGYMFAISKTGGFTVIDKEGKEAPDQQKWVSGMSEAQKEMLTQAVSDAHDKGHTALTPDDVMQSARKLQAEQYPVEEDARNLLAGRLSNLAEYTRTAKEYTLSMRDRTLGDIEITDSRGSEITDPAQKAKIFSILSFGQFSGVEISPDKAVNETLVREANKLVNDTIPTYAEQLNSGTVILSQKGEINIVGKNGKSLDEEKEILSQFELSPQQTIADKAILKEAAAVATNPRDAAAEVLRKALPTEVATEKDVYASRYAATMADSMASASPLMYEMTKSVEKGIFSTISGAAAAGTPIDAFHKEYANLEERGTTMTIGEMHSARKSYMDFMASTGEYAMQGDVTEIGREAQKSPGLIASLLVQTPSESEKIAETARAPSMAVAPAIAKATLEEALAPAKQAEAPIQPDTRVAEGGEPPKKPTEETTEHAAETVSSKPSELTPEERAEIQKAIQEEKQFVKDMNDPEKIKQREQEAKREYKEMLEKIDAEQKKMIDDSNKYALDMTQPLREGKAIRTAQDHVINDFAENASAIVEKAKPGTEVSFTTREARQLVADAQENARKQTGAEIDAISQKYDFKEFEAHPELENKYREEIRPILNKDHQSEVLATYLTRGVLDHAGISKAEQQEMENDLNKPVQQVWTLANKPYKEIMAATYKDLTEKAAAKLEASRPPPKKPPKDDKG